MQRIDLNNKTILVTGSPGFIGANLVIRLLKEMSSGTVVSLDNMNDYYDVSLKEWRLKQIGKAAEASPVRHVFVRGSIGSSAFIICWKPAAIILWSTWCTRPVLRYTEATRRCRSARTTRWITRSAFMLRQRRVTSCWLMLIPSFIISRQQDFVSLQSTVRQGVRICSTTAPHRNW